MQDGKRRWLVVGMLALMLVAFGVARWFLCWGSPVTVLLVRHADRQIGVDALTAAGTARAQQLAHVLANSEITAIYTSEASRTQRTAAPTASVLGVTPRAVAGSDVAGLVRILEGQHRGEKVLVVGHSDSVPKLISGLGGPSVSIASTEYDNLYVLERRCCLWERVAFTHLRYGGASPR